MSRWTTLLGSLDVAPGEVLLYLDPHALDHPVGDGELWHAQTRWDVRRVYEQQVRGRTSDAAPLVLHVTDRDLRRPRDLPWDIGQLPYRILDPELPDSVRDELHQLPPDVAAQLVGSGTYGLRLASAARYLAGRAWPPEADTVLATVVCLLPHTPPGLRRALAASLPVGAARDLLSAADPRVKLDALWQDWAAVGGAHPLHPQLHRATGDLIDLVASGYLTPTGTDREDLPQVVRLVRPAVDHLAAAAKLLDNPPPLPGEVSGSLPRWLEIADWWAAVRLHFAAAPPASFNDAAVVTGQAWWNKTDTAWVAWLRAHYGAQLSRSHVTPATVDKIGAHLNHAAVVQGDKVLLLVMDGMGVAQWQYLRKVLNLTVATDRRVLAMLPTITSVSRQAIFAGQLPTRFPDSINRTDAEDRRWREFWIKAGLSDREVHYARTPGRHAGDWPDLPDASVVGVAINAVDDLVHGSDVNDDHQLLASLGTWAHAGLVPAALAWARRHGHRVWLTADHGNVVSQGLGQPIPNEGAAVPSRGIRVRQYANPVLRNVSKLPGIAWDPPGYPPTSRPLLFAPGSMCYRNSATLVTHGGLSLDEVVIPFVEVIP